MRKARGFSLVELMIALTIGAVLVAGAVYVYSQSRRTHTVTEVVARLQENGRYVFSILEPDVQLAGYYGFGNIPDDLKYMRNGSTASVIPAAKMQRADGTVPGLDSSQTCGNNFAVDVIATIEGGNNKYGLSCAPPSKAGAALADRDTLTIRRSTTPPANGIGAATANRLQLLVSRLSPTNPYIFADGVLPATPALKANLVQVRDLLVRTYYIATNSTDPDVANLPALRVKALADGPAFTDAADQEVMRGVEDFQVQFGIDTGDYNGDGAIDTGLDTNSDGIPDVANGVATKYVNPDKLPVGFQVVAVRIWILLRAEQAEQGFVDNKQYVYADRDVKFNDGFRRVLMSRTIQLRNARPL